MKIPGLDLLNGSSPLEGTEPLQSHAETKVGSDQCESTLLHDPHSGGSVSTQLEDEGQMAVGVTSSLAVSVLASYPSVLSSIVGHLDPLDLALASDSEETSDHSSNESSDTPDEYGR